MANNLNVNTLTGYIDQTHDELIAKTVLGAKSIDMYELVTDVKGPTTLNTLASTVAFQNGATCGFNPDGNVEVSNRTITPAILKVDNEFCEKAVLGHYAQHLIKVAAGKETMPWEQAITANLVDNVNKGVETMLYYGDKSGGVEFDGIMTILAAESTTIKPSLTGTTAWDKIAEVYAALPEEVLRKEDVFIGVSPAVYRAFVQALVASNLYHYDANDSAKQVYLPGTNCPVIMIDGLDSTKAYDIIATYKSNVYVGVDMAGDEEKFTLDYDKRNETWMFKVRFAMGVQVLFPDFAAIAKF